MKKSHSCLVLSLGLIGCPLAQAQTASEALDAAWLDACAGATPGTDFYQRCQEILNQGPGSGGRRSAAALGNNLELFAAQGRLVMAMAKARSKAAARLAEDGDASADGLQQSGQDDDSTTLASGSRWAVIGSAAHIDGSREESTFERGSDDSARVFLLGLDYRISDRWTAVVAMQREDRDTDFRFGSGGMAADTDMLSASLGYATDSGFSAGLSLSSGRSDARVQREIDYTLVLDAGTAQERSLRITGRSDSESDADLFGADLYAGWERGSGSWTWRYGADLSWQRTEIDDIIEDNARGLDFLIRAQEVTSLRAGLSAELARTLSSANAVWQPYVRVNWQHEFQDDPRQVLAAFRGGDRVFRLAFSTAEPDRNFGEVGLGVAALFPGGWQAYAGWQRMVGHDFLDEDRIDLGVRHEF